MAFAVAASGADARCRAKCFDDYYEWPRQIFSASARRLPYDVGNSRDAPVFDDGWRRIGRIPCLRLTKLERPPFAPTLNLRRARRITFAASISKPRLLISHVIFMLRQLFRRQRLARGRRAGLPRRRD